jgi:murein L,D-transpeptidase YcbB/YkuD
MKKFLLTLVVAFGMLGTVAHAESNKYSSSAKTEMSSFVEKVLALQSKGYTKDQIVDQLLETKTVETPVKVQMPVKIADTAVTSTTKDAINFGQFKKALKRGDNDDNVKKLQEKLNKLSKKYGFTFQMLNADGKFGPATAEAVKAFQISQGLTADGVFGMKSLERLEKFLEKYADDDSDDSDDDKYDDSDDSDDDEEDDDDDHGSDHDDNDDEEDDDN